MVKLENVKQLNILNATLVQLVFLLQIFRASHDAESVASVMLYSPVVARYIRIYPYLAHAGMALRTEIFDHDYG
jgi:hypothetical protein